MADTDLAWERIARTDPYWGVLSHEEYLGAQLPAAARSRFFATGEEHIAHVFGVLDRHVAPGFAPRSALDYGCGVGRLLVPLSRRCQRVVGVDVSATMLDRAAQHLAEAGRTGVSLVPAGELAAAGPPVEFLHSALVFQHIARRRGMALLDRLLGLLAPGGCGALQFQLRGGGPAGVRGLRRLRERSQLLNRAVVATLRRPAREALVLMHPYDGAELLRTLAGHGAAGAYVETTARADGDTSVFVYFRRDG
jgi:SAM-dependent methyltransferase